MDFSRPLPPAQKLYAARFAGFEAASGLRGRFADSNRYKMVLRRVNLRPRGPRSLRDLGPSVGRFPHRNTTFPAPTLEQSAQKSDLTRAP